MLKRAFDIVFALVLGLVLAPLTAVGAVAVRLSLGKPVLFRHVRPGRGGRPFVLYKLRTMRPADPASGALDAGRATTADEDAARLTRTGQVLRRMSLDEVPQLWNVLRGDMSLVGPRPLLIEYLPFYTPEQALRHEVRPGLTGLAQVQGRHRLEWNERFALDVHYVKHRTFAMDMRILLQTVKLLLLPDKWVDELLPFSHTFAPRSEKPV